MRGYRLWVCKCITQTARAVTSSYPGEWVWSSKPSGTHDQKPTWNNQGNVGETALSKYFNYYFSSIRNIFFNGSRAQSWNTERGDLHDTHPCLPLEIPTFFCLSMCLCVSLSRAYPLPSQFLLTFSEFCTIVSRGREGSFGLHLHVKWSVLLCGGEVPPDSPSPVACQTEPASSPHSPLPAGVGHDSTVRNILRSCQSPRCQTGVNHLKRDKLARTNMTHSHDPP